MPVNRKQDVLRVGDVVTFAEGMPMHGAFYRLEQASLQAGVSAWRLSQPYADAECTIPAPEHPNYRYQQRTGADAGKRV